MKVLWIVLAVVFGSVVFACYCILFGLAKVVEAGGNLLEMISEILEIFGKGKKTEKKNDR